MLLLLQLYAFFRQTIILYVSLQQLLSSKMKFPSRTKKTPLIYSSKGLFILLIWGGRIRTSECLDQNQVPYHLATPHHGLRLLLYPLKLYCQYWLLDKSSQIRHNYLYRRSKVWLLKLWRLPPPRQAQPLDPTHWDF